MLPGRTVDQKRALIEKVTDAVSETTNAPKENITVFIEEMDATHYGQAGVMHADKNNARHPRIQLDVRVFFSLLSSLRTARSGRSA
ncbi:putative tautomerase ywhB domain protein [Exiguobacterium sp. S17]|nr:putative tautomerase ywhB domain protein [Exiguobacterium sp. S17]